MNAFCVLSGDLMGSALDDIDSLLRMPTGCGEQNMLKFAPNIFVMQYLSSVDRVTDEINATSTKFLQAGVCTCRNNVVESFRISFRLRLFEIAFGSIAKKHSY